MVFWKETKGAAIKVYYNKTHALFDNAVYTFLHDCSIDMDII